MFLKDYFKKRAERRAEKAEKHSEWYREYHRISDLVYDAIRTTDAAMDGQLSPEFVTGSNNTSGWKYKIDERLTVTIFSSYIVADHHRVFFNIDGIEIDTADLESYRKIATELTYDLERKLRKYLEKKVVVVDDYIKWKERKTNDSLDSDQ